jgi:L-ascorbate metabolism protein UlaG (beta-lactamase superfamily)
MKQLKSLLAIFISFTGILLSSAWADELKIERLTWAGIKLVSGDTTVFVDAVGSDLWNGKAPEGLVPVTAETKRRYALITHAHNDHFDIDTLKAVLGERGYVICHESIANYIASRGLRVISAKTYHPILRGGFVFTPVPAEDGFGDEQVSWVIAAGDKRVLHAGDTLWHGQWSTLGKQYGSFDAVFLPVNGAKILSEPLSEISAVMTPEQAVNAAVLLRAKVLVPIHYGLNSPPDYVEVKDPIGQTLAHAKRRSVIVQNLKPGEWFSWPDLVSKKKIL